MFRLTFTQEAENQLLALKNTPAYQDAGRLLGLMQLDLKDPRLQTKECKELSVEQGCKICESFESSLQTLSFRVFWTYNFHKNEVVVITIIR